MSSADAAYAVFRYWQLRIAYSGLTTANRLFATSRRPIYRARCEGNRPRPDRTWAMSTKKLPTYF